MPVAAADGGCSRGKERIYLAHIYVSIQVFNNCLTMESKAAANALLA
jgi:hypothetical protein